MQIKANIPPSYLAQSEMFTLRGNRSPVARLTDECANHSATLASIGNWNTHGANSFCLTNCIFMSRSSHSKNSMFVIAHVLMFSYGSGLAACMFSLRICPTDGEEKAATEEKFLNLIGSLSSVKERLDGRKEIVPSKFVEVIETRTRIEKDKEFTPTCGTDDLWPGTYYLKKIDEKLRRFYERK